MTRLSRPNLELKYSPEARAKLPRAGLKTPIVNCAMRREPVALLNLPFETTRTVWRTVWALELCV